MKTGSPTLPALIHTTVTALAVLLALTSLPAQAIGRLLQFDARALAWRESAFARDPACTVCR